MRATARRRDDGVGVEGDGAVLGERPAAVPAAADADGRAGGHRDADEGHQVALERGGRADRRRAADRPEHRTAGGAVGQPHPRRRSGGQCRADLEDERRVRLRPGHRASAFRARAADDAEVVDARAQRLAAEVDARHLRDGPGAGRVVVRAPARRLRRCAAAALPMSLRPVTTPPEPRHRGPDQREVPIDEADAGVGDRRVGHDGVVVGRPEIGRCRRQADRRQDQRGDQDGDRDGQAPKPGRSHGTGAAHVRRPLGRPSHGLARPPESAPTVPWQRRGRDRPDAVHEGDHQALVELRAARHPRGGSAPRRRTAPCGTAGSSSSPRRRRRPRGCGRPPGCPRPRGGAGSPSRPSVRGGGGCRRGSRRGRAGRGR